MISNKKLSSQSPQTATISLIREPALQVSVYAFRIILDGKKIGSIPQSRRQGIKHTFEVEPGQHTISLRVGLYFSPKLVFSVASGEEKTFYCRANALGIELRVQ